MFSFFPRRAAVFFQFQSIQEMEVSIVMGVPPIAGWFIREHPIKIGDARGYPYFRKAPYIK
jgi:hypothetical protein